MGVAKYKYYFSKPKSEIAKDILFWIAVTGMVVIAATSPYFIQNILRAKNQWKKYNKKKIYDMFTYLKKREFISIEKNNKQLYISLTEEGKKKAGMFQIDSLQISTPKRWDRQWRILIFDVIEMKKAHREALRGKLKQLDFYPLQKSVWVHPFDCRVEIDILRDFFGLSKQEMCLIIARDIEDDHRVREHFKLS